MFIGIYHITYYPSYCTFSSLRNSWITNRTKCDKFPRTCLSLSLPTSWWSRPLPTSWWSLPLPTSWWSMPLPIPADGPCHYLYQLMVHAITYQLLGRSKPLLTYIACPSHKVEIQNIDVSFNPLTRPYPGKWYLYPIWLHFWLMHIYVLLTNHIWIGLVQTLNHFMRP